MRNILFVILFGCLALPGWSMVQADPGTRADRVSSASSVDDGHGVVVISVRSEMYLTGRLDVFFLAEGGDVNDDGDVFRFERRQGIFALGNDTVGYQVRTFQLPAGTYRLAAHGIDCPKVPAVDERCLLDVSLLGGRETISRPSRGYGAIAPTFEVRSGSITYAGDFALTARNTLEWSEIPVDRLAQVDRRFGRMPSAPEPFIPGEYRLKYGLNARSFEDDRGRRY
jgi:hypothetical protein